MIRVKMVTERGTKNYYVVVGRTISGSQNFRSYIPTVFYGQKCNDHKFLIDFVAIPMPQTFWDQLQNFL